MGHVVGLEDDIVAGERGYFWDQKDPPPGTSVGATGVAVWRERWLVSAANNDWRHCCKR